MATKSGVVTFETICFSDNETIKLEIKDFFFKVGFI